MELKYKISESFPEIERIDIKVIDDNGWPWNRFKEFSYNSSSETAFHLECPRPKCLGHTWKSHATLTLLAKQDCPLWLQYD